MRVSLFTSKGVSTIILPEKVSGQYWLHEFENLEKHICVEAVNENWVLKSNKNVSLYDEKGSYIKEVIIQSGVIYSLRYKDVYEKIFVEEETIDSQIFEKYILSSELDITIGRNENNDIVYDNKYVSNLHTTISYRNNGWILQDNTSSNGTFVNGAKVTNVILNIGDCIYIMGLKIIVGKFFLAINNPEHKVRVKNEKFLHYVPQQVQKIEEEYESNEECFYRPPRFKRNIEKKTFKVENPPNSPVGEEMPIMLAIGPSMTMGMASMSTAIFSFTNALKNNSLSSAIPTLVMSFSMLLGCIMWPIISKQYEKKRKKKKEALRQKRYREYLDELAREMHEECLLQEELLRENHVTVEECSERIETINKKLWERTEEHDDFLVFRVGSGQKDLVADFNFPEKRFVLEEDNLQDELFTLCEKPQILNDVPITISLVDNYMVGIIGEQIRILEFVKGLILQMVSLYAYDEISLVFLYNPKDEEEINFIKWLPHVWSKDKKIRFIASNQDELKEVSQFLQRELDERQIDDSQKLSNIKPHYIVFILDKYLGSRFEILKQILRKGKNCNFSFVSVQNELKDIPKESSLVIDLLEETGKIFNLKDISGNTVIFKPDILVKNDIKPLCKQLLGVQLDTYNANKTFPNTLAFLEMFGVGKIEHLNVLSRWKENDPTISLKTPIGVDGDGELFYLDLHEKYHGPHGLVAGMTGSGKSETIITYILSLAVNYHPEEVAFILIDYKGGGMAKAFEKLPHTAGIITNLDGAAIKRSLISIESELKRRQAIFAKVGKQIEESNIDIYKYQKLYREKIVTEPLQHLFIISDEFAELKTQQPEFMAQLISAARIGRSLGVHLILATQKPSGVVDDQIWSNSKFKVCLKVQERADSMDMLKRPDAAELSNTGRFYLQVGYNEFFEMGQSAWAGAPYFPTDRVIVQRDNSICIISNTGQILKSAKIDNNQKKKAQKQLDALTNYLHDIANEEKINIRSLWLEPISAIIMLGHLEEKYHYGGAKKNVLNPIVGEYDNPASQSQHLLTIPISNNGNVVIYGAAESGKTMMLKTMIFSLISEHSPKEMNLYILDFASETLQLFCEAPHVGDVILSHDKERIDNLFKLLSKEINIRKRKFSSFGGNYASYIEGGGSDVPNIVVVIHNYVAFSELYESYDEVINYLTREGVKYGIYFVLTALNTSAVRFRLLQNFSQFYVLQLNDENEYSTVLGRTEGLYPSKVKGRGLYKSDKLYEFQVAHICEIEKEKEYIISKCAQMKKEWNGDTAPRIAILPKNVNHEFLKEYYIADIPLRVPVGVSQKTLDVKEYDFSQRYINMILSTDNICLYFLKDIMQLIKSKKDNLNIIFFDITNQIITESQPDKQQYASVTDCREGIKKLFDIVLYRNNTYKETLEKENISMQFEPILIVIYSLSDLLELLEGEYLERMELILEKGEVHYGINIIIANGVKKLSRFVYDSWYKKHISIQDGIWIGNGFSEQYQFAANTNSIEMKEVIGERFGFVIQNGEISKIKRLCNEMEVLDE